MATLYGIKHTDRFVTKPPVPVPAKWFGGRVRAMSDQYTLLAAPADGDVVKLGRLPKGALIVGAEVDFADLDGSGGTIDLGWRCVDTSLSANDDDNGILAAVDVTSAGSVDQAEQTNIVGRQAEMAAEVDIELKFTSCDATSGLIRSTVFYVLE